MLHSHITSVFGSSKQDQHDNQFIVFKKVGYSLSVLFFFVSIVIHLLVEDVRKELGGKLVICMTATMAGLYTCLLSRAFMEDYEDSNGKKSFPSFVKKDNPPCIILGKRKIFFKKLKTWANEFWNVTRECTLYILHTDVYKMFRPHSVF